MAVLVRLDVLGDHEGDVRLRDWLTDSPELRGRVERAPAPVQQGDMGAVATGLIVAITSAPMAKVLAAGLKNWLTQRHQDLSISLTTPDGLAVTIDGQRLKGAAQIEHLLITALQAEAARAEPVGNSPEAPGPMQGSIPQSGA
jgi:Flp pilus assembly pilin Flp